MKMNESVKKTKKTDEIVPVDFKEQTPKIEIRSPKPDPLYEKAFLSREDKNTSEYAQNTTTWD